MAATAEVKVYTGTTATVESPSGDAGNLNLMSTDTYDSTGSGYESATITVPTTGTAYSYERWLRIEYTGTFNSITNVKFWKSAGSLSDGNLTLNAGETSSAATPTDGSSSLATSAIPTAVGSAIDISTTITSSGDYTDYGILQLAVPTNVTTPGDIGSQTITFQYDES